ncbi:hypothetical protein FACS189454_09120 [Planctomycetales bacterium]|nr:hypothetical protein FACS189454_09120 [Planctomycetales bacterium]
MKQIISFIFFITFVTGIFAEKTVLKPCVPFGEQLALTGTTVAGVTYQVPFSNAAHAHEVAAIMKAQEALKPQMERLSNTEIYRRTMGTPSVKALDKAGWNVERYIETRGLKSIAGKAFEARTAIRANRFFQNHGISDQIRITAIDNRPVAQLNFVFRRL